MWRRVSVLIALFVMMSVRVHASGGRWLYVSLLEQRQIICFQRDAASGALTRVGETDCPAEPAFLTSSADGSTLFVALRSTGELASYHIDCESGRLRLQSIVLGGDDPAYLQTDGTDQFLVAAYYVGNKVTVNQIATDGTLSDQPLQTVPTAEHAHGVAFSSDNKWMLVPHTAANQIHSFHFDDQSGLVKPSTPPFFETPSGHEPRHIALHRSDRWVYTGNEKGDSISMYELEDGRLDLKQTLSTIPDTFDGSQNSTARCAITPDSRFIYVANRGHDSIAAFSINPSTGRLAALGRTPTEKTPRSFAIDATGQFLYVAGQRSGRIAGYRIQKDGTLAELGTYDSGPVSWAVVAVDCE